ncbi:hypothetical protein [Streptomyces liangshanensis]|uniref:hypothetical protein n=1 Tax=Streptomyces liangshanensis TaxID=2717324 RepID=UPI0036DF8057
MAALLRLASTHQASEIVEALVLAAHYREEVAPELAARWRSIANEIGDALDHLPTPTHLEQP